MKKILVTLMILAISATSFAQNLGINNDGSVPDPSAGLDVKFTDKGMLIPRVALTGTGDVTTIASPLTSLLVYNTATAGTSPNNVTPGYYYWNGSVWVRLSVNAGGSGTTNYLPKWNSSGMLGNSLLFDDGTNVGIGTTSPAASAALDVSSTTKGFLPPRMSTTQRDAISSLVAGLTIYNTSKNCNETYNGTSWVSNSHYIGESYGGGIVFYVYDNGQHGLISATSNQSTLIQWNNGSYTTTNAVRDQVYAGRFNTERVIINQGAGSYAAQICANYQGGGYGDWYLPSKHELNLLYMQKAVVGGFYNTYYWSSSEDFINVAWAQSFVSGYQNPLSKDAALAVRAVRAF